MVWRKKALLQSGKVATEYTFEKRNEIEYLENLKKISVFNIKRSGHFMLVIILRLYLRSLNFLKEKWSELKKRIIQISETRNKNGEIAQTSKFLKVMAEYKNKIREIKHKIQEEENIP
jgi:hypothetical protein